MSSPSVGFERQLWFLVVSVAQHCGYCVSVPVGVRVRADVVCPKARVIAANVWRI